MLRKLFPFLIGLFAISITANSQTVINVPSDYSTIQAALNNAIEGDTVLVQPGTYYENIIWPETNGIKLISSGDSSNTIIDGGGLSSAIYINLQSTTIDTNTIIQRFKITNGNGLSKGGGLFLLNANPMLNELMLTKNSAEEGGGIYLKSCSNINIRNSQINSNSGGYGAGLLSDNSNIKLTNVIFDRNIASDFGGGLDLRHGQCELVDITIQNNTARHGGGIRNYSENLILKDVIIKSNNSEYGGGLKYGADTLINVLIIDNTATYGGGICAGIVANYVKNVFVVQNNAIKGGGLFDSGFSASERIIKGITISNNNANSGGGIYLDNPFNHNGKYIFENVTISNNKSTSVGSGIFNGGVPLTIVNSNLENNGYGLYNNDNLRISSAINNWWGHSSGPYHPNQNLAGLGDSTNMFVNVDPWLIEPDTTAPPLPIQNVTVESLWPDSVKLVWDSSPIGDLKGYKIYYDTDSNNYVYDSYANQEDVGMDTSYVMKSLEAGKEYYFTVTCYDNSGNESWYSEEIEVNLESSSIEDLQDMQKFNMRQNQPNPFANSTTIQYTIPEHSFVNISVYSILGTKVKILVNEDKVIGSHSIEWRPVDITPGIYFYILKAQDVIITRKLIILNELY